VRVLFALAGIHQVDRGAEIAFLQIASNLKAYGDDVTVIGSGPQRAGVPYHYIRSPVIPRERFERFPSIPVLRNETHWEDASFAPGLLGAYRPADFDVTITCAFPFTNWVLRRPRLGGKRPPHVFVTQNGDWPARSDGAEYRWFGADGLICTNPDYFNANRERYRAALIPNGVDLDRFNVGAPNREAFGLPVDKQIVLMASALIESKFVDVGIEAVSRLPDVHLAVAGDGPLRDMMKARAEKLMPGRFHNFTVTADRMPDLYRSADVFLHLSRDESFGNVFVEAMACGRTTVAWDLERTRWITGETARLVPDGDKLALTDTIEKALREPLPAAQIALRADRFSWRAIAGQYHEFLESVVGATTVGS
jgi:glycosyltransferase involved in cell wall biosynthesis